MFPETPKNYILLRKSKRKERSCASSVATIAQQKKKAIAAIFLENCCAKSAQKVRFLAYRKSKNWSQKINRFFHTPCAWTTLEGSRSNFWRTPNRRTKKRNFWPLLCVKTVTRDTLAQLPRKLAISKRQFSRRRKYAYSDSS